MYCNDCGLQIPKESEVCPYCGTSTKKIDPHSEHRNNINSLNQGKPAVLTAGIQSTEQAPHIQDDEPRFTSLQSKESQIKNSPPKTDASKTTGPQYRKPASSVSPGMILAMAAIILLIIAFPVMRIMGIELPMSRPKPTVQPAPVTETVDTSESTNNADDRSEPVQPAEKEDTNEYTSETNNEASKALFTNEAIEQAVAEYFNVESTGMLSAADLSEIEGLTITTYAILINNSEFEVTTQIGDVDIGAITEYLSNLKILDIANARTVSISGSDNLPFTRLKITDSSIADDLKGIENAVDLKKLIINNTDLTSLKYIASCPSLTELDAANNKIKDIESLRGTDQITNITLYGNKIKDYTALGSIKYVNVWGDNINPDVPESYVIQNKPDAYCFTVNISNLHMRSKPSTESKILIRHIPKNYYIILATKKAEGYTWYKVGNNAWVADNGSWLKFFNN